MGSFLCESVQMVEREMKCSLCPAIFRRLEHLQRHLASHGEQRPFRCDFCGRSYKRRDVLKRHWKTCAPYLESGLDISNIFDSRRGKKPKACDRCVRLKKACTFDFPCSSCQARQEICSYERLKRSDSPDRKPIEAPAQNPPMLDTSLNTHQGGFFETETLVTPTCDETVPLGNVAQAVSLEHESWDLLGSPDMRSNFFNVNSMDWDICPSLFYPHEASPRFANKPIGRAPALVFLSRFTSVTGFIDSFECGREWSKEQAALCASTASNDPEAMPVGSYHDGSLLTDWIVRESPPNFALPAFDPTRLPGDDSVLPSLVAASESLPGQPLASDSKVQDERETHNWVDDPLAINSLVIIEKLKDNSSNNTRQRTPRPSWSPLMNSLCSQFFSPSSIRRHLRFFWSLWYPNCPILHKPTFTAEIVSPVLLATMVVIGACVSPEESDKQRAKLWLDRVEELAFEDGGFDADSVSGPSPRSNCQTRPKRLECLQAMYFVCLFQNWEGSNEAKRRIRRLRFSTVVTVAREFTISTASHRNLDFHGISDLWWRQFIMEEELIRTLTYVFLLDVAFTIFYNSPPRMAISELQMDLTCPEECFQTYCADECLSLFAEWTTSKLWQEKLSVCAAIRRTCQREMTVGSEEILVQMSTLNMFTTVTALHNLLFHMQTSGVEPNYQAIESGLRNWNLIWEKRPPLEDNCYGPSNTWKRIGFMRHAGEFWLLARIILERFQHLQNDETEAAEPGRGVLHQYDDTDMSQVNRLIMEFRDISI